MGGLQTACFTSRRMFHFVMLVIHPGETARRKPRAECYSIKDDGRKGWKVRDFQFAKCFIFMFNRGRNQVKKESPLS